MVGRDKERDWDREMAEVDKLLAKLPEADPTLGRSPTVPRGPRPMGGVGGVPGAAAARNPRLATWIWLGLGGLVGAGMLAWPYSHVCGIKEMFYLVGVGTVFVTGVWSSISSWRARLGFAHLLSHLLIIWGLILGAREVLPRVGYAKTAGTFFCPEPPVRPTPNR